MIVPWATAERMAAQQVYALADEGQPETGPCSVLARLESTTVIAHNGSNTTYLRHCYPERISSPMKHPKRKTDFERHYELRMCCVPRHLESVAEVNSFGKVELIPISAI